MSTSLHLPSGIPASLTVVFVCIPFQDLKKGTKILAADGTILEVSRVDVQQTTRLLEVLTFGCLMRKGLAEVVRKGQTSKGLKMFGFFPNLGK